MNLEALQDVALRISEERSVDGVLRHIVEGLIHGQRSEPPPIGQLVGDDIRVVRPDDRARLNRSTDGSAKNA